MATLLGGERWETKFFWDDEYVPEEEEVSPIDDDYIKEEYSEGGDLNE